MVIKYKNRDTKGEEIGMFQLCIMPPDAIKQAGKNPEQNYKTLQVSSKDM